LEGDVADDVISGGYLLEVDARFGEPINWRTQLGVPFNLHDPDPISAEQLAYIRQYVQETETALYSGTTAFDPGGYGELVDVESFVNWYLINEFFRNNDAVFFTSVWLYKARNQKLVLGPVWDFDIAAGLYDGNDSPMGWYIRDSVWIQPLFSDPAFVARVKERWAEKRADLGSLIAYIDQQAAYLSRAQDNNFRRWPILNEFVWPHSAAAGSYQGELQFLEDWLEQRITWMDAALPMIADPPK
jgi:hypothetical protein